MNAMQLPKERVDALDPARIEEHLLAHGWQERPESSSVRLGVFRHPSYPGEEILLPRDKDFVDYALRVGEALVTLGGVEKKTAWEMLESFSARRGQTPPDGKGRPPAPNIRPDAS